MPSFTELEWGIRPSLERWAEVASFDTPGVGDSPFAAMPEADASNLSEALSKWRDAAVERGLAEVEEHGWERFVVVTDSHGSPTAVRLARKRRESVLGLAIGHASLSHGTEGERAPMRAGAWDALTQLAKLGSEAFVRHGIAQFTQGGIDEEVADRMLQRFPDMRLVGATLEALGQEPEPIGDDLAALDLPLLLAKHEGCFGRTDEGFDDIVAAFPEARTAICPEDCSSSPVFAAALREFCEEVTDSPSAPPG